MALLLLRGASDEFSISDVDLGELTAVTISHDGSGTSPAWHLDHIEVTPCPNSPTLSSPPQCMTPVSSSSNNHRYAPGFEGAPDEADYQTGPRGSTNSPSYGMRMSAGGTPRLRRTNSRGNTPVPFSQSRAGVCAGAPLLFPCNAWLDECLGGGVTKRRLTVSR